MNKDSAKDTVEFEDVDEDDIEVTPSADKVSSAVVYSSDWTVETIVSQIQRGNIHLTPGFQRRDAWKIPRKSKFIESLMLGLPIPQIVLAEKKDERGKFVVLDGKQRLLSIMQFVGQADGGNNSFRLTSLEIATDLEKKTYATIVDDAACENYVNGFLNGTIRAVVIRNWPGMWFLHLLFLRLNTNSVQLSPQELRQAMFPGDFSVFIENFSANSQLLKDLLHLEEPDFRMRDVELTVRFLAFTMFLPEYRGNIKAFLDEASEKLNDGWNELEPAITHHLHQFEQSIEAAIAIFGYDDVARRPIDPDGRKRPFNRALFDCVAFYFASEEVRNKSLENSEAVQKAMDAIWRENTSFVRSLETTTKSITSVYTRLSEWGKALSAAIDMDITVPRLEDNRILYR